MRKMRFLSILLAFVLVLSNWMPAPVYAVEGEAPPETQVQEDKPQEKDTEKEQKEEKKEEDCSVTGVSISRSALSLKEGESEKLSAEVSPENADNKSVSWESSDSGVASVDGSGKVTAKSAGSARITVRTKDGGLTATCNVTVTGKEVQNTGNDSAGDKSGSTGNDKSGDSGQKEKEDTSSGNTSEKKDQTARKAPVSSKLKAPEEADQSAYKTSFADGTYTDFTFKWEGGTGKANLQCTKVIVEKGIAYGEFKASSSNMTHVFYAGHTKSENDDDTYYNPETNICGQDVVEIKNQIVRFPILINKKTDISCRTTAMSVPHWIQYAYTIGMEEISTCKVKLAAENEDEETVSASFTVKDPSGKEIQPSQGNYTLEIGTSYPVTAKASGYETWEGNISPSQDGETITLVLTASTYKVKIKAIDQDKGSEVKDATITVTDEKTGKIVIDTDGSYQMASNHLYTISVTSDNDYEDVKKEHVSVSEDKTIEIPLKALDPEDLKEYSLSVAVKNEDGESISDAAIEVTRETSEQTQVIKPSGGKYKLIAGKNYTVKVSAKGYESDSREVQLSADGTETFVLKRSDFKVHVRVIDQATEHNLSKAVITVKDDSGKTYSGTDGTYLVPYQTALTVSAVCAGYETAEGAASASQALIVKEDKTVTLSFVRKTYAVKVSAIDSSTGKAISGARFTVTSSETNNTVAPSGGAYPMTYSTIYTIEASASGYATASMTHKATADTSLTIKLTPTGSSGSSSSQNKDKTEDIVNNGTYNIKFKDAENNMFNVVGAVLHVKDGKYTADISLSGTGYDYLYPSTAEAAIKAGKSKWSKFWKNGKGLYTYTIEVPYLDKPFIVASRSIKYSKDPEMKDQAWRDGLEAGGSHGSHEIILYSKYTNGKNLPTHKGVRKASSVTPATDKTSKKSKNSKTNKKTSNKKTNNTSNKNSNKNYPSNTSGGTSSVNNTTGLKDGTYKPDSFSFSGGTGRVQITCDQIIIKGGKTYARITFSSTYFQYVKAGGQKITNYTRGSNSTSFVIPVELNKNNKILGMTTKMSQPHEIAYNLYIGLEAAKTANGGNGAGGAGGTDGAGTGTDQAAGTTKGNVNDQYEKLDPQAPAIIGLNYKGEVPVTYSDKIKIYEYQDGFTLVELDVRKGTALDKNITGIDISTADENNADSSKAAEDANAKASSQSGGEEEQVSEAKTASELKAALYDNNVYKYLFVPENGTIPAGIEKQLFVVQLPADQTVVTSHEALEVYDQLKLYDMVMGIGIPKEEIKNKNFKKRMDAGEDGGIKDIGTYDDLDYKQLLLNKADVLMESSEVLPHLGQLKGFSQKTPEEFAQMTAEEKDAFKQLALEKAMTLKKIGMRGVQLGMGVIVDRSADEENDLAKAEWLKLYGVIFNKKTETEAMYKKVVDKASDEEKKNAAIQPEGGETSESGNGTGAEDTTSSSDLNGSGDKADSSGN